jgi:long-chain acyl-CoA synthetase
MTDEEYFALGLQAPPTRIDPPNAPRDVASLIDRAAKRCPDDEALDDGKNLYRFVKLARAVSAVASLLDRAGISSGDRVAASLGNEANLVIAFFAAMRLGAVWVGINKILPPDDKYFILDHSGSKVLLTDSSIKEQVDGLKPRLSAMPAVWYLDLPEEDGGWAAALSATDVIEAPRPDIDPYAPAAIMYTSGTTGVPKGVVHSQHNMIVVSAVQAAHNLMAPHARRGAALPLTITNLMILGPITAFLNCKPFLMTASTKIGPLIDWLHEKRIEQIAFVPTMVYDLLQSDRDLPDGIELGAGGAPLPAVIRENFCKRYGFEITAVYGLTEAPTVVSESQDRIAPEGASGFAMPHLEITICDANGGALPAGVVGEICFAAVKAGPWANVYTPPLGYWREPEKTRALLDSGVVHSGDSGSLDPDGWLTIADRSSELILRGGSNVYPAEVERILQMHSDVEDCAVVGKSDLRMGMLTVAFIQSARPQTDAASLQEELRIFCLEKLTRYKVPDEWRFMTSLPRNAMGKVIKAKLRELVAQSG